MHIIASVFRKGKKLLERLDQTILDVMNNPKKTQKLPVSECYDDKRSTHSFEDTKGTRFVSANWS